MTVRSGCKTCLLGLSTACVDRVVGVLYLVNAGASVSSTDGSGGTALHAAVGSGNLEIVTLLVSNGAAVNAQDSYSETPLYHAASYGHVAIARHLVDNGASVTLVSHDGLMPRAVAELLGHTAVETYLRGVARTALSDRGVDDTSAAFVSAAGSGNLAVVKLFVAAGMSVDTGRRGGTVWLESSIYYRKEVVTVLAAAAAYGQLEVVKYLVGAGSSLTAENERGRTPWAYPARNGRLEVVKYLVGQGLVSVTATNSNGNTALHYAAGGGRLEVVKYLVGQGASVTATTSRGSTPRDWAEDCKRNTHPMYTDERRARCSAVVSYFDSLDDDDE